MLTGEVGCHWGTQIVDRRHVDEYGIGGEKKQDLEIDCGEAWYHHTLCPDVRRVISVISDKRWVISDEVCDHVQRSLGQIGRATVSE
jgi:hypothetical protein